MLVLIIIVCLKLEINESRRKASWHVKKLLITINLPNKNKNKSTSPLIVVSIDQTT